MDNIINIDKFPNDFMFRLTEEKTNTMVSQNATPSKQQLGGSLPYVFTEQGVYMLATILKSKVATKISISIMRTFVKLKSQNIPYLGIMKRLESLESDNKETKDILSKVISAISGIQELQNEAKENTKQIGFITK